MNKKITLFCSSFPPETGAAPGRMYQLAKMLVAKGYEVTVICAMPNYPTGKIFEPYRGKIVAKEKIDGISVRRIWMIPTHSSNKLKRMLSLFSYSFSLITLGFWYLLKSNPSVLIISSPPFVTGYIGLLLAKFTNAKTILNISDLWPKTAFELGFLTEGKFYDFLQKMEQKMYNKADAFTVQSERIKEHIEAKNPEKKIFVYRNLQASIPQASLERNTGKRKIVYAGLLGIAQGVFDIVTAINFKEHDTELHIYGQGFESDKIQSWIDLHPTCGVYYHGSVPADKIPDILTDYHAMLIPLVRTIDGAVPSKIFNAMANGLPILFSGNGEAADIVKRTSTGLVSPAGNYQQLSENIKTLVGMSAADYEMMRRNCLEKSEMEFNKKAQDASFLHFVEQV